ncbi:ArsC family reductase [Neisseria weaveri]|uniref:ArsC family reductase n=1 Tax=Neisseria weaveri TaxID=28091 RepID=UPI0002230D9F|nr:ArsC family reductase [Neisseria weaveri]EGV36974.1 hypothetical protein l13_05040 [Neisseria weaveri ATCC 51223]
MITLHGIPNCDTVKKARKWLETEQIDYVFWDFKKQGVTAEMITGWLESVSLDTLLNKRGTTWRKLDQEQQAAAATQEGAIRLMTEQPSLIKRPVLTIENQCCHVGFTEAAYTEIFKA